MGSWSDLINDRLQAFRQKYYVNLFVRGLLLTLSLLLAYYLVAVLSEYFLWLDSWARLLLVSAFAGLLAFCMWKFLLKPLLWFTARRGLTAEEAARIIGKNLHAVDDRLLNIIQLAQQPGNALTEASLQQKFGSLRHVSFEQVVDLRENKKYLPYLAIPLAIMAMLFVANRSIITGSTERIIKYNQQFSPQAPFRFNVLNQNLTAFYGEDFVLRLQITGERIPEDVYVFMQGQNFKMTGAATKELTYTFEKVQSDLSFQFYAAGFYSEPKQINLITRPELAALKVTLAYPPYLGKATDNIENAGNLDVPEGTKITWRLSTSNTAKSIIGFRSTGAETEMQSFENQEFTYSKSFQNPDQYWISLSNEQSENKDKINYSIAIIKDQYPELVVSQMRDSVLYKNIFIGGSIADDHGLSLLKLSYEVLQEGKNSRGIKSITIPINRKLSRQEFVYAWSVDSLNLKPNDQLTYFIQVWDNDGVNGSKSTKSASYVFHIPSKADLKNEIAKSESKTENELTESIQKAETLREKIEDAQKKLRGKQVMDWQDKALLEDIIRQKQEMDKLLNELIQQNKELEQKRETFTERDERLQEKAEQLQKLMHELLDEETKKLFEELEKLLKENSNTDQTQKLLNKMQQQEMNLEKELDRLKELFEKMKFDSKMEETINDLNDAIKQQEEVLQQTEKFSEDKKLRNNPDSLNRLMEKQQNAKETLEQAQENLQSLEELNQKMEDPENLPDDQALDEAGQQMDQSKQSIEKGEPQNSKGNQQKAVQKMQEAKKQMESAQGSMQMEMDMENMESLRQILHGLIKLSFDQEQNTKEFNEVQQTDPRYLGITQNQLKLQDDAKVLEDSLLALGKRDPFMGNIVIKEVGELNDHLNKAIENIRERRKPNASSEMQLSMTSINNLALMLNDHFEMMMQMMQNAKMGKGKGKQKGKMKLSEMQQQLNQQIEDVKKGGKTGRQLSEEMARLAAEQEAIRKGLQELEKKLQQQNGKKPGGNIAGQMEQTEMDLVNKQITEQTIRRQKDILQRLLESEKSVREQDLDEERKGEAAKDYINQMPKEFLEYLKLKEKELELLKTVPLKLYPYYKREASEYFKRMNNE
jgi:hypothetical protein